MTRDGKGEGFEPTIAAPPSEASAIVTPATAEPPTVATHAVPASQPRTMAESWPTSSASPPSELGSSLMRYRLEGVIGRGGMGEVVSARDEQIGRSVAIKRMRGADASPDAIARFEREARIQGQLEHPAMVPVHELWRDDHGQPFFVMKQLSGTTLAEVLARLASGDPAATRAYSLQRLLRAFTEVCLAIEFAHTRGVIHRDLKPANIMLGDFGEVYVLDWGIAHVADQTEHGFGELGAGGAATQAGSVLGTPGYMSPEQIRGDAELDGRADVYALGCILFEILALEPLHPRGLPALASALTGTEVRPSVRAPDRGLAPELDAVCLAALMADRADRLATARELGDAVQRFLDGDRDVALRRELAHGELATAHAALARGGGLDDHRTALRAAARALALDPRAREPAELVGRLMLEPPASVPPEVEHALGELDLDALYGARHTASLAGLAFFAFVPILWLSGYHDAWYFVIGSVLAGSVAVTGRLVTRARMVAASKWIVLAWLMLVALFAVISTPLLVAPGIAAIVAMSIANHPIMFRAWALAVGAIAAVLVPWLLAIVGVLPPSVGVVDDALVLHAGTAHLEPTATLVGAALYVVILIVMAVLLARSLANDRRTSQRIVQIQAWQLRQLVPQPE